MFIEYEEIRRLADSIREICGDDDDTFLDTLDGETDVVDVLSKLIQERLEVLGYEATNKELAEQYKRRADKMATKADAINQQMKHLLNAMGVKKVNHALATVSITKPRWSVEVVDEAQVPTQLKVTTSKPDLRAIKKILDDGEPVPGCRPKVGYEGITVRIK
ncbi:MAG: siphovirus Gp157 family protein [Paracoccaceae bacterium]